MKTTPPDRKNNAEEHPEKGNRERKTANPNKTRPVLGGSEGCRIRKDEPFESFENGLAFAAEKSRNTVRKSFSGTSTIITIHQATPSYNNTYAAFEVQLNHLAKNI